MKLGVYSLKKVLFEGEVKSINCPTASGEITILENHLPLISLVKAGTVKIIDHENNEHYVPVIGGLLEVRSGHEARFLVEVQEA